MNGRSHLAWPANVPVFAAWAPERLLAPSMFASGGAFDPPGYRPFQQKENKS